MDLKDLHRYLTDLSIEIPDAVKSDDFLNDIGKDIVEQIKTKTRSGLSTTDSGQTYPLKPLTSSYVKERQRLQSHGKLSGYTSPSLSNLTKTNTLLESITWRSSGGALTVTITNPKQAEVAKHVSDTRPFLNIANTDLVIIIKKFDASIDKAIAKKTNY